MSKKKGSNSKQAMRDASEVSAKLDRAEEKFSVAVSALDNERRALGRIRQRIARFKERGIVTGASIKRVLTEILAELD